MQPGPQPPGHEQAHCAGLEPQPLVMGPGGRYPVWIGETPSAGGQRRDPGPRPPPPPHPPLVPPSPLPAEVLGLAVRSLVVTPPCEQCSHYLYPPVPVLSLDPDPSSWVSFLQPSLWPHPAPALAVGEPGSPEGTEFDFGGHKVFVTLTWL